jgi:magnesium chelatase family protein
MHLRPCTRDEISKADRVRCSTALTRRSRIEVPRVEYEKLSGDQVGESSESIRGRVQTARDIQNKRFSKNGSSDIVCNVDMRVGQIRQFCRVGEEGQRLMGAATSCCA